MKSKKDFLNFIFNEAECMYKQNEKFNRVIREIEIYDNARHCIKYYVNNFSTLRENYEEFECPYSKDELISIYNKLATIILNLKSFRSFE